MKKTRIHPPQKKRKRLPRRFAVAGAIVALLTCFSIALQSLQLIQYRAYLSTEKQIQTDRATAWAGASTRVSIVDDDGRKSNHSKNHQWDDSFPQSSNHSKNHQWDDSFPQSSNHSKNQWDDSFPQSNGSSSDGNQPVLTLLVMLTGEFGNNVFKIINGWGAARLAERDFGLTTRIVFSQQRDDEGYLIHKAVATTKKLQTCFQSPAYFKTGNFPLGNQLLDEGYFDEIREINWHTLSNLKDTLQSLVDHLAEHPELTAPRSRNETIVENGMIIPRAMVRVTGMDVYPIVNEFYEDIRKTFVFDETKCCGNALVHPPGDNEVVLHLRNFASELTSDSFRFDYGFQELDSQRIATKVLGHLKQGDQLALVGRNIKEDAQDTTTEAYSIVSALKAKNLTLRFGPGTTSMEDFCFLTQTKKELVGNHKSTFVTLAAFLAGPSLQLARLYQYVPTELGPGHSRKEYFESVVGNWSHPELRSRMKYQEFL